LNGAPEPRVLQMDMLIAAMNLWLTLLVIVGVLILRSLFIALFSRDR